MSMSAHESGATGDRVTAADLAPLLRLAREGDREALAELLLRMRPLMVHVAHQRATASMPVDDLVATATLRFIEALAKGAGPTSNPAAYMTASIRNLATDHGKLRESSNLALFEGEGEPALAYTPHEDPAVELMVERSMVREAFERLKPEDRELLQATVVDGRKPSDLAHEHGMRPNTVAVRASRARASLAVELRSVMLGRNATPSCAPFRDELARRGNPQSARAREHYGRCAHCPRAVASFKQIPMVLAALPLILLGGGVIAGGGAAAASVTAAAGTAASGQIANRGSVARDVAADRRNRATALLVAGVVALAALLLGLWLHEPQRTATRNPVSLQVIMTEGVGSTAFAVTLDVHDEIDGAMTMTLELPATMRVSETPEAWECVVDDQGAAVCTVPAGVTAGVLVIETFTGEPATGQFALSAAVTSGTIDASGSAVGNISVR